MGSSQEIIKEEINDKCAVTHPNNELEYSINNFAQRKHSFAILKDSLRIDFS